MDIRGAKGGGKGASTGSSRTPRETPDSLRSIQYARTIDLLCEGEIEGPGTGDIETSLYLDKTVFKNSDGSKNFSGVTLAWRPGTQVQTHIAGFPGVESESSVGVQLFQGSGIVQTITNLNADAARVTLSTPALSFVDRDTGDTKGATVHFLIELQADGGSYETVIQDSFSGKTTSRYQRAYTIKLAGTGPWNIRVTRISDDSNSARIQTSLYWDSYTEIINAKLRYPNSALVASIIDAQQFSNIPTRAFDTKLLKIQIPSNATVREDGSLEYSGTWDGTFQIAWAANPAWVFYDMITSNRYGLGDYIDEAQVDKWALYTIGQYCDALVADGFGGFEPRFTCNLYLQTQEEAFKVMQDLASIFRGMVYWSSGVVTATQDAPSDPVALFTNANVVDGDFNYSGSSAKVRHSVALVSWNDPEKFYELIPEYVENPEAIERYGIRQTSIVAIGCTSRGQAHRAGKWLLYAEANETETVTFRCGLDRAGVRPGQIIQVQDHHRAGVRRGGRIVSATDRILTLDRAFVPTSGVTYSLTAVMPDGTLETREIQSFSGDSITLALSLPTAPQANAIWAISSEELQSQLFRVVSNIESEPGVFEISGLSHNPSKYAHIENDLVLDSPQISLLNEPPNAPGNLSITEALYQSGSVIQNAVTFGWGQVERADYYTISYKIDDSNPVIVDRLRTNTFEIRDAVPGKYTLTAAAVSVIGKRSLPASLTVEIYGKTAPPSDVTGFSMVGVSGGVAQLVWDVAPDLDVRIGGNVRIRHSPATSGAVWNSAVDIGPALPGVATTASVPHIDGSYLAKFVDSSGYSSVSEAVVTTRTASLVNMNVVTTIDESAFSGTKTNVVYPGPNGGLSLDYAGLIDDMGPIDSVPDFDTFGDVQASGEYLFASTFDLGAVYISRLTAAIEAEGFDDLDTIDERTGFIDSWSAFDGDVIDDVNAALYVRTTNDNPAGSPTWSSWRPFFVGQYEARAFQFKLILTSQDGGHNINVSGLTVIVDMPDRVESQRNLTTGTGAYSVTFPAAFKATPSIGITANNMATGDYYSITSPTATGFTIQFFNAGGSGVARNFDYMAKGYGFRS